MLAQHGPCRAVFLLRRPFLHDQPNKQFTLLRTTHLMLVQHGLCLAARAVPSVAGALHQPEK